MSTFFALLPIYIFGNLHCIGMCGPLVLMLGRHRYRTFYFLGRTASFTLAGALAGGVGAVLQVFLQKFHVSAFTSFFFGGVILALGFGTLLKIRLPGGARISAFLGNFSAPISCLILRDTPLAVFLFGFLTIALPCGQTIIVFSACAIVGDFFVGMVNGLAFALLTSPSLFLAMNAENLLQRAKGYYHIVFGISAIVVGVLAMCRGFADVGLIEHYVVNPKSDHNYHIALY